jgi:hypothetical protein
MEADVVGFTRQLTRLIILALSGSMSGEKLVLLKQAMGFVIDNLGPRTASVLCPSRLGHNA